MPTYWESVIIAVVLISSVVYLVWELLDLIGWFDAYRASRYRSGVTVTLSNALNPGDVVETTDGKLHRVTEVTDTSVTLRELDAGPGKATWRLNRTPPPPRYPY